MRKTTLAVAGLVLLSFILSIYFYPQVPEQMATHWDSQGEVDGYMSKFWGLFFTPVVITCIAALFLVIPRIDPKKENIEKFRKYYDRFVILFLLFMVVVHLQILLWNVGIQISPNIVLPVGTGLLFYYIGILIENADSNWFVGIRTPWTLSSDRVWKKTNQLGGKLFKLAGLVAICGTFFPKLAVFFVIIPVLLVAGFTVVYSYYEYVQDNVDKEFKGP